LHGRSIPRQIKDVKSSTIDTNGHARSIIDELSNIISRNIGKHIIVAVFETDHMNPSMGIGIPRSALRSRLSIGVIHTTDTNRNGDAIGESHREAHVHGIGDDIDTRKRVGDGGIVGVHSQIVPRQEIVVNSSLYWRERHILKLHKPHTRFSEIYHLKEMTCHHKSHKSLQSFSLPL
jgi:hypothetical protein